MRLCKYKTLNDLLNRIGNTSKFNHSSAEQNPDWKRGGRKGWKKRGMIFSAMRFFPYSAYFPFSFSLPSFAYRLVFRVLYLSVSLPPLVCYTCCCERKQYTNLRLGNIQRMKKKPLRSIIFDRSNYSDANAIGHTGISNEWEKTPTQTFFFLRLDSTHSVSSAYYGCLVRWVVFFLQWSVVWMCTEAVWKKIFFCQAAL